MVSSGMIFSGDETSRAGQLFVAGNVKNFSYNLLVLILTMISARQWKAE
jgi:hypothetical protein